MFRVGRYEVELVGGESDYRDYQINDAIITVYDPDISGVARAETWRDDELVTVYTGGDVDDVLRQAVYDVMAPSA